MNDSPPSLKPDLNFEAENQEIFENLERIISLSETLLENNKHGLVFSIFNHLVKNDLTLRQKIANELFPGPVEDFEPKYSQEELNEIIQLQTFANNFRIALLVKITEFIIECYKEALKTVEEDRT